MGIFLSHSAVRVCNISSDALAAVAMENAIAGRASSNKLRAACTWDALPVVSTTLSSSLTATRAARQPFSQQNTGRAWAVSERVWVSGRARGLFHANQCTRPAVSPARIERGRHSLYLLLSPANKPACLHFRNFGSDKHHASFGLNHFKTTLFHKSEWQGWRLCWQLDATSQWKQPESFLGIKGQKLYNERLYIVRFVKFYVPPVNLVSMENNL